LLKEEDGKVLSSPQIRSTTKMPNDTKRSRHFARCRWDLKPTNNARPLPPTPLTTTSNYTLID
jgi:hypothetical protein